MSSKLIEVTGIVINPQFQRFDDGNIIAVIDCNGPLRAPNQHLWDAIESHENYKAGAESASTLQGCLAVEESARGKVEPGAAPSPDSLPLADGKFRWSEPDMDYVPSRAVTADLKFKSVNPVEEGELVSQRTYHFYGELTWYDNKRTKKKEPQVKFVMFRKVVGHGQAGVVRYLTDCPHVGDRTANALWAKFESDAVRILRESPEIAVAAVRLSHFTETKAREASEHLISLQAMESCTIDLIGLLDKRGFPKTTAQAVVREWGNQAADIIRRDPYKLGDFRGCGFLKCDKMFLSLGGNPAALKRQALAALFFLANDTSHTWSLASRVGDFIRKKVGGVDCNPMLALRMCKLAKAIEIKKILDPVTGEVKQVWIADAKKAAQERTVCARIISLLAEKPQWPDISLLAGMEKLSDHQRIGLTQATRKPFGILRGDPGTGKSFTTIELILSLEKLFGPSCIAVCAQAGAAADRIKKDLVKFGSYVVPRTIHSLLGRPDSKGSILGAPTSTPNPEKRNTTELFFKHNADNPLPHRFVFLDECSMPGTDLFAAFLSACGTGTQVLLIGDDKQLPPISHGAVMRDCIAAGVPTGELTEPQRNAGTMVLACQDIKHGRPFRTDKDIDPDAVPPRNLNVIEAATPQEQIKAMLERHEWAKSRGLDPIWDVQVVVAVNANSPLGREPINKLLQDQLNPNGARVTGNPFRVGDKVVCNDNGNYQCEDRYADYADEKGKCRVSNGTFGCVLAVEEKKVVVKFFHPDRLIVFSRTKPFEDDKFKTKNSRPGKGRHGGAGSGDGADGSNGSTADTDELDGVDDKPSATGCPLDLAYAGTCHMLQGSERKYVLPLLDEYPGAGRICMREWFFTGISRGKWLTQAIGRRATADAMCLKAALPSRKTFLREMLVEAMWGDL